MKTNEAKTRADAAPGAPDAERSAGAVEGADLRQRWEERRGRFGDDVSAHRSPVVRALYVAAGTLSLATGIIGIFVPLLPTTVFVLMAAACYVKASPRLYDRVMSNRFVGLPVYTWQQNRSLPPHIKVFAITVVVLTFTTTITFAIEPLWARISLTVLGLGLLAFLWRIPTTRTRGRCPVLDAARTPERSRSA